MELWYDYFISPIGTIYVVVDPVGIKRIFLFDDEWNLYKKKHDYISRDQEICKQVITQLKEYFNGERLHFELPRSIEGTEFQESVWGALDAIPYGEVRSYSDIAKSIGNPKSVRAIGQANKSNKLPIIIPCHRVIGKKRTLVGYAGNHINIQETLLLHEGVKI